MWAVKGLAKIPKFLYESVLGVNVVHQFAAPAVYLLLLDFRLSLFWPPRSALFYAPGWPYGVCTQNYHKGLTSVTCIGARPSLFFTSEYKR